METRNTQSKTPIKDFFITMLVALAALPIMGIAELFRASGESVLYMGVTHAKDHMKDNW